MFGRDEAFDKIKAALAATDSDMAAFKSWQKKYEKLSRQWQNVRAQYENACSAAEWVNDAALRMESMITGAKEYDRKEFAQLIKEMKHRQDGFDHEFLVSREDREFHSTYDTIVRLGIRAYEQPEQKLILQSEIENLLALLKENLAKEKPSAWKLAFYLMDHTEKELEDLPANEKIICVNNVYEEHFLKPILNLLMGAIQQADRMRAECRNRADRRSRKYMDATEILDNVSGEELSVKQRAERIVGQIAECR
mgnify:CR=1 FL=1